MSAQFVVFVCGLAMIVAGVWLVSESAGLIVGGVFLACCAFLYERGPSGG